MQLEWQKREKHYTDLSNLIKELGWTGMRKFVGNIFWPKWESLGHTKCHFEDCVCSK